MKNSQKQKLKKSWKCSHALIIRFFINLILPIYRMYQLLTFYKFVDISDPHEEVTRQKQFLVDIGMKWRIYIGEEWISSTVTGNAGQVQAYKRYLHNSPYFTTIPDLDEKITLVPDHQFEKMIVKYRPEIVALWAKVTAQQVAEADRQLSIEEFKRIVEEQDEERAILDMRNDYEWQLGHFKGAIPAGTVNFREVPDLLEKYKEKLKDKKVLMYCTGWIRCEKLSVLLKENGQDNFWALNGGVVKYTNTYNDGNWLGNLYTFDGRVSCQIGDETTNSPIATCIHSGKQTNNCDNCRYSPCNARITVDSKEHRKHMGFCSQECVEKAKNDLLIKNVDRDPVDYKSLRGIIKQDPTQKQAIITKISAYIDKKLLHRTFVHAQSQKEKVVYEW